MLKKFIEGIQVPFIALVIIAAIYGTLNIITLKNEQRVLSDKYQTLETRLAGLESSSNDKIAVLEKNNGDQQSQIDALKKNDQDYNNKLSFYQKQINDLKSRTELAKTVLGTSTSSNNSTPTQTINQTNAQSNTNQLTAVPKAQQTTPTASSGGYVNTNNQKQATISIQGVGTYKIDISDKENAYSLLQKAANKYSFSFKTDPKFPSDPFITEIAGKAAQNNGTSGTYWALYKNGKYSSTSAKNTPVSKGDTISWKLENWSI